MNIELNENSKNVLLLFNDFISSSNKILHDKNISINFDITDVHSRIVLSHTISNHIYETTFDSSGRIYFSENKRVKHVFNPNPYIDRQREFIHKFNVYMNYKPKIEIYW